MVAEAEVADKVEMEEQVVHEAWQAEVVDMAQLVQVAQQAPPVQVAAEQIQMDLMAEVEAEEERLEVMVQMVETEAAVMGRRRVLQAVWPVNQYAVLQK
jgi:hypothetical protein